MRKVLLGVLVAMVAALSFSMAQADQIDGLQSNPPGPLLPEALSVYVNPGDLGDALIGGYYNARGSWNMISVVNTSGTTGIVVKVRFREGKYSNEVLDFFVCLSAGDRWTAWVIGDENEDNPATIFIWDDDTPTCPDFVPDSEGWMYENFKYGGTGAKSCVTADMTKEGYFTVIAVSSWADPYPGITRAVQTDEACCVVVNQADSDDFCIGTGEDCIGELFDAGNYLTGTVTIYDLVDGAGAYAYNMTALADFTEIVVNNPGLGLDNPPTFADCQDGLDGLNYVLTKESLIALYDIEDFWDAKSDVIITFPTKTQTIAAQGFQDPFHGARYNPTGSWLTDEVSPWPDPCEKVDVTLWDDEENSPETTHGFSPTTTTDLELCNEVNYIIMGERAVSLLNTDLLQFKLGESGFDIGWVEFDFTQHLDAYGDPRGITLPTAATLDARANGLPVIGYELGSFIEGIWGHMLPLRYTSDISMVVPED